MSEEEHISTSPVFLYAREVSLVTRRNMARAEGSIRLLGRETEAKCEGKTWQRERDLGFPRDLM